MMFLPIVRKDNQMPLKESAERGVPRITSDLPVEVSLRVTELKSALWKYIPSDFFFLPKNSCYSRNIGWFVCLSFVSRHFALNTESKLLFVMVEMFVSLQNSG